MYKWVDDKGVVHYTDQVPPDAVNKGNVQLSPQGIPIRKIAPATTPEQRKAREAEPERQREAARRQTREQTETRAARPRAAANRIRPRATSTWRGRGRCKRCEAALQSAQGYSDAADQAQDGADREEGGYAGKPVPRHRPRTWPAIDAELARQGDVIARKRQELVDGRGQVRRRQGALAGAWPAAAATPPRASARQPAVAENRRGPAGAGERRRVDLASGGANGAALRGVGARRGLR